MKLTQNLSPIVLMLCSAILILLVLPDNYELHVVYRKHL